MQLAPTWAVIGMGFALFLWLLNYMRSLDRRMADGFADMARRFSEVHRELGKVHAEIAEVRADLRLDEQRGP